MPEESKTRTFTLRPSWKHYFFLYLFSALAVLIFGLGLIALYVVWKKHREVTYEVTDTQISSADSKYYRTIDLVNIERVELEQSWMQQKLGIGTLVLHTSAVEMRLAGMAGPEQLRQILEQAVAAQKKHGQQQEEIRRREPEFDPGSIDKINYLTGLWQQGLISDEDYEKERKHFE